MGTEQLNSQRSQLRRSYRQKRLQLSENFWQERSQLICAHLAGWQIFQRAPVVFSFISHLREPNLETLRQEFPDKIWALPRCQQNQLHFHPVDRSLHLVPNPWGILEPPPDAPMITPDRSTLCLVPGLVFDQRGYRLGFGKGYYDRFGASYPDCLKVGVFFWEFLIDDTRPQPWDIPMNYLAHDRSVEPVQN